MERSTIQKSYEAGFYEIPGQNGSLSQLISRDNRQLLFCQARGIGVRVSTNIEEHVGSLLSDRSRTFCPRKIPLPKGQEKDTFTEGSKICNTTALLNEAKGKLLLNAILSWLIKGSG